MKLVEKAINEAIQINGLLPTNPIDHIASRFAGARQQIDPRLIPDIQAHVVSWLHDFILGRSGRLYGLNRFEAESPYARKLNEVFHAIACQVIIEQGEIYREHLPQDVVAKLILVNQRPALHTYIFPHDQYDLLADATEWVQGLYRDVRTVISQHITEQKPLAEFTPIVHKAIYEHEQFNAMLGRFAILSYNTLHYWLSMQNPLVYGFIWRAIEVPYLQRGKFPFKIIDKDEFNLPLTVARSVILPKTRSDDNVVAWLSDTLPLTPLSKFYRISLY